MEALLKGYQAVDAKGLDHSPFCGVVTAKTNFSKNPYPSSSGTHLMRPLGSHMSKAVCYGLMNLTMPSRGMDECRHGGCQ